ncbi:hypothetical protein [Variovorax sp. GT1P44]|uniref:hypothetical protein n=1 Tax=Variovorax sp. GT1P44 TaxID=3443742 RepID=UPI003F468847
MELGAAHRDAKEAEQRHVAHERRLLADVDRERVAARQMATDLAKEQKSSAPTLEAARGAEQAARQALQAEKAAHNDAAATWSRKQQESNSNSPPFESELPGQSSVRRILPRSCSANNSSRSEKAHRYAKPRRRQPLRCASRLGRQSALAEQISQPFTPGANTAAA